MEKHGAEEGGQTVVGYATHVKAFERRSNIQFVLKVELLDKPEEEQFSPLAGGPLGAGSLGAERCSWQVDGEVAFTAGAGELNEEEKGTLFSELLGEDLALGVSERPLRETIKVFLFKSGDGIRLEMDVTAKAQILEVFDDVKTTRGGCLLPTLYLCRDCASLDHFRSRQANGSCGAHEQPSLHVLGVKYAEPCALVRTDIREKLKAAVATSDSAFGQTEIFKCVNMTSMDRYMSWKACHPAKKRGKDLHDFRQNWSANQTTNVHSDAVLDDGGAPGYVVEGGVRRHARRFLLSAECQIGKTGTYLALLHSMYRIIRKNAGAALPRDGDGVLIVDAPARRVPGALAWKIPHWFNITSMRTPPYGRLGKGKYILRFARIRYFCLLKVIESGQGEGWRSWLKRLTLNSKL